MQQKYPDSLRSTFNRFPGRMLLCYTCEVKVKGGGIRAQTAACCCLGTVNTGKAETLSFNLFILPNSISRSDCCSNEVQAPVRGLSGHGAHLMDAKCSLVL